MNNNDVCKEQHWDKFCIQESCECTLHSRVRGSHSMAYMYILFGILYDTGRQAVYKSIFQLIMHIAANLQF